MSLLHLAGPKVPPVGKKNPASSRILIFSDFYKPGISQQIFTEHLPYAKHILGIQSKVRLGFSVENVYLGN